MKERKKENNVVHIFIDIKWSWELPVVQVFRIVKSKHFFSALFKSSQTSSIEHNADKLHYVKDKVTDNEDHLTYVKIGVDANGDILQHIKCTEFNAC